LASGEAVPVASGALLGYHTHPHRPAMGAFRTNVDIANRVAQHCGQTRLDPVRGLSDGSKLAREISACYDKSREAELQRNTWTFSTRRTVLRAIDANTLLLDPALWVETTTYFIGSIVADQSGNLWISNIANNLNNDPLLINKWEPYFGPLAVPLYVSGTSYSSNEVVYTTPGDGTSKVYLSLQDGNTDNPGTATAYDATAVYSKNQVVTYLSVAYMSLINLNTNNTPSASPAPWSISTTYAIGNKAAGSDGYSYTSLVNSNIANDPTLDSGTNWSKGGLAPWTTVFVGGSGSAKWLQIGGSAFPAGVALIQPGPLYPVGAGPAIQRARNVFKLPAGYLRTAPQYPKGRTTWLGGPSGETYNDWNIENGFLVSSDAGPINFRFVADVTDVRRMTAMFCEGLAARIAMSVSDTLTQSNSQMGIITKVYAQWMGDARMQNAIETGYDDLPDDDYVTVRL
jgi:hypothetical protein